MVEFKSDTIQCHIARYNSQKGIYEYLILKRSAKLKVYPNVWQAITGTLKKKETPLECMYREAVEEIAVALRKYCIYNIPYVSTYYVPFGNNICFSPVFGVIIKESEEIILSEEHQDYKWVSSEELTKILLLPSHVEAHNIFCKYIIESEDRNLFKVK